MNYKTLLLILSLFIFSACNQEIHREETINIISGQKYKNAGFTLVYNKTLKK